MRDPFGRFTSEGLLGNKHAWKGDAAGRWAMHKRAQGGAQVTEGLEWPVLFAVVMTVLFLAWVFGDRS